ncbi:MAG: ATP-binding protein [bacterium]
MTVGSSQDPSHVPAVTIDISTSPDPAGRQREIQTELVELRRRIAELEHTKLQLEQQVSTSTTAPEAVGPVTTSEELEQTLRTFVRRVAMILQAEKCAIMQVDYEAHELVAKAPALRLTDEEIASFRVPLNEGISGEAFHDGKAIICNDVSADPRADKDNFVRLNVRDSLTVPMIIERRNENQQVVDRNIIGVIHVFNKRYGLKFTEEDIRLFTVLARNAASVISSANAFISITAEKKQLEYTLQSMSSGLLVISKGERIQLLNSAASKVLGVDASAIGKSYQQVIVDEDIREFLAKAIVEEEETAREFLLAEHNYQAQTAKVRDEKNAVIGLLVVLNDVTELRNVERMKSDFVSTVSHELRTPLTAIKGFVRTLIDDPNGEFYDQETRMEFYGIIDSECDRLVRLISDLLNVSRIERGLPVHLNYSEVNVKELVDKCVNFQRSYTEKHEFVVESPADISSIIADQDKLDQILTNLISNSIKYSPNGGEIKVAVTDEPEKIVFAISDHGMGIPEENIDKVFQRFYRVASGDAQSVGGTGIGLFLVKSLVQAHGGDIWVDSTYGKGSTFYFTLPKKQPEGDSIVA